MSLFHKKVVSSSCNFDDDDTIRFETNEMVCNSTFFPQCVNNRENYDGHDKTEEKDLTPHAVRKTTDEDNRQKFVKGVDEFLTQTRKDREKMQNDLQKFEVQIAEQRENIDEFKKQSNKFCEETNKIMRTINGVRDNSDKFRCVATNAKTIACSEYPGRPRFVKVMDDADCQQCSPLKIHDAMVSSQNKKKEFSNSKYDNPKSDDVNAIVQPPSKLPKNMRKNSVFNYKKSGEVDEFYGKHCTVSQTEKQQEHKK